MRFNIAACKIACPQDEIGSLDFISNGLAINCRCLINDLARPFVYEHEQQDVQHLFL